ncbi:putative minor capsid protein [Eel River basin pequenovirus]|nr:putative minor capsid protein [Eel River basin pequenovirus]
MQIRDHTDETRRKARVRTKNDLESKTVRSELVRSEIKHILAQYEQTGVIDHLANVDLQFRDVSEFTDFADLMRQTKIAEMEFMKLPSKLREVFNHDVNEWLDVAHDPEKLEAKRPQLEKLGVLDPKEPAPAAPPTPPATPPAQPPTPPAQPPAPPAE